MIQKENKKIQKMFIVADLVSLIGPLVSEKIFEIVDGRQTEAGVTGILLAHP